jgi:hypothetical protein
LFIAELDARANNQESRHNRQSVAGEIIEEAGAAAAVESMEQLAWPEQIIKIVVGGASSQVCKK